MESKDILIDGLTRIQRIVVMSLEGLNAEQLAHRPSEQANTIAWLVWHLTRVQDDHISSLARREQAWVAGGWHARFGKAADPHETGQKYSPEQVAGVRPESPRVLLDYHNAVFERSKEYVQTLQPADLDVEIDEPQWNPKPTVGVRLVSVLSDNLQHAGQAAYVRGLVEDKHWFPA